MDPDETLRAAIDALEAKQGPRRPDGEHVWVTGYRAALRDVRALLAAPAPAPGDEERIEPAEVRWQTITCQEREALIDSLGRSYSGFSQESGVGVHASSTDMSPGGLVFTEWGYREGKQRPVLRDYRWNDAATPCRHEVPAPAATEEGRQG